MNRPKPLSVLRDIESPPGGWRYTVPQTGVTLTAPFFRPLYQKVVAHMAANGIEVGEDFRSVVEHGACIETKPPGSWCAVAKPKAVQSNRPAALLLYVDRFLRSVWHALKDRKFESEEVVAHRISVCKNCPLRSDLPAGCLSCFSLVKSVLKFIERNPNRITPDEDGVVRNACGACWCLIDAKVLLPNSTLDKAEGSERPAYWEGCWRNENIDPVETVSEEPKP